MILGIIDIESMINLLNALATDTVLKIDTNGTTIAPGHNLHSPSKKVNFSSSSS